MGNPREKGKIPHSEWSKILARYNGGETIASIGRAYGCTAPAIRYIVKRSGTLKSQPGRRRLSDKSEVSRDPANRLDSRALPNDGAGRPLAVGRARPAARTEIISEELRKRLSSDIASFLVALDQVVLAGAIGSLADLQDATDRLMRSTARTRLELERVLSGSDAEIEIDAREKATSSRDV